MTAECRNWPGGPRDSSPTSGSAFRRVARRTVRGLAPLAVYAVIVAWITWPLVTTIRTGFPAVFAALNCDRHLSAWTLAWSSRSLLTQPTAIADANIYHPARGGLFYGQAPFGALPYFAPVFLLTANPVLALNLTLLGGLAVTAWFFHIVVRRWTGSDLAGFVAAATFLSNRFVLGFIPTTPHRAALQFFPLIAYAASRPLTWVEIILLVPLIVLQCLTDCVYIAPAVLAPLGLLAAIRTLRPTTRAAGLRLVAGLAMALALLAPVYAAYVEVVRSNPDFREQTVWKNPLLVPQSLPALVGQQAPHGMAPVTILLLAVSLAVLVVRRGRPGSAPRSAWAAGVLWWTVGSLVAFGGSFVLGGRVVHMPMYYLSKLVPLLGTIRVPVRSGYAALAGVAILSGLAFAEIGARLCVRDRWRAPAAGARFLFAALIAAGLYFDWGASDERPSPWRTYPAPVPPARLVRALLDAPGPVLELPLEGSGELALWPSVHARAMFHSIYHWQPLLNGYNSYYPTAFPRLMALAAQSPNPSALTELRKQTGLRYVWLDVSGMPVKQLRQWQGQMQPDTGSLRLVAREGSNWLFAFNPGASQELPTASVVP
jgi:hypothetical protein